MQKYQDTVLAIGQGVLVGQGASVTVNPHGSVALASIYQDTLGVTVQANPITADANGRYAFYAPNGHYDITITYQGRTLITISDIELLDTLSYNYQQPTTGFSLTGSNTYRTLLLDPAGTLAAGTVTMPASPNDGQDFTIASSQTITALTVSANTGQTIKNAVTTLAAGGAVTYKFNATNTTWYRVQ